jgi:cobalt-precorrin 5A hydrolase
MVVAGVGFRRAVEAQEIAALVARALEQAALPPRALSGLATADALADAPPFLRAAEALGVPAIAVARASLEAAAPRVRTRSARSLAAHGVGSVAEAAALGAAGPTSTLVLERVTSTRATCALACGPHTRETQP